MTRKLTTNGLLSVLREVPDSLIEISFLENIKTNV